MHSFNVVKAYLVKKYAYCESLVQFWFKLLFLLKMLFATCLLLPSIAIKERKKPIARSKKWVFFLAIN